MESNLNTVIISVIVPCYNQAEFLDECLNSVRNQSFLNWECIIVNDGSNDDTEDIAQKWVQIDPRFKYYFKDNGGLSAARNFGIDVSNGDWILPLDADDKISVDYLELANAEFSNGYKVIYCNAELFGTESGLWILPEYNYDLLLVENMIFCSAFFRKENWKSIGGYDEIMSAIEDWEFWIHLLNPDDKVYKIDSVCFYYRIKEESRNSKISMDYNRSNSLNNYIFSKHINKYLLDGNLNAITNYRNLRNKALLYDNSLETKFANRVKSLKKYKLISKLHLLSKNILNKVFFKS